MDRWIVLICMAIPIIAGFGLLYDGLRQPDPNKAAPRIIMAPPVMLLSIIPLMAMT